MRCAPYADMVLVHWTGQTNYPLGGDEAVQCFLQNFREAEISSLRAPEYRLDIVRANSVDLPDQG
jgi:hypothetical protein